MRVVTIEEVQLIEVMGVKEVALLGTDGTVLLFIEDVRLAERVVAGDAITIVGECFINGTELVYIDPRITNYLAKFY